MHLKKITLTNFRQFYGTQELEIAGDSEKNVTLIHAENGVGKTTVLNAILWCFYKDTTARFEQPDKIANHQAISEGNHTLKVEVSFSNDGDDYLVTRECDERTGEDNFKAFVVTNGNYTPLPNPSAFVDSVVPREMAKYFFFDGEYAETFSSQKNKSMVRDALEDMLGCRTANAAIKDLNSLQGEIEKQIAALTKNNSAQTFQDAIDVLETEDKEDKDRLVLLKANLEAAESARDDIAAKLRGSEDAKFIQKQREEFEKERSRLLVLKKKQEAELTGWINDGGIGLIAQRLEEKTQAVLEDAKLKGKIPSYIADTFVNDILHKMTCICERHFEENSKEAEAIRGLLQDAGTATATDRLMNARVLMGQLSEKRSKAMPNFERIKAAIKDINGEISVFESKIEECGAKLRGSVIQEVADREAALEARYKEINDYTGQISLISHRCEERTKKIEEHKAKRDKLLKNDERAVGLQKRAMLLAKTAEKVEEELKKYREDSRNAIVADVNVILEKTARRNYFATIDEKFNLDMHYKDSKLSVARSGGENQLLSLAFIAALIKFSSDRMKSKSEILKPGTSAPLVLDSPFGQLDPTYQKATSKFLPDMAKQVVLLLSKTQGNPEVMQTLKDKIGREYILVSENTGPQGEKPADNIHINGTDYASSRYNCEKTLTRIVAV
jgi:DNA sulfur modification protein DndD